MSNFNKYYRSAADNWICGVCGGLGRHTGIDPLLWRLLFFLTFGYGGGIVYFLIWFFTDEE